MEPEKLPNSSIVHRRSDNALQLPRLFKSSKALKQKLGTALRESAQQFLSRRPKTFPRFSELPDELQIRVIELALAEGTLVAVHQPSSPKEFLSTGWWAPPHPLLSVSRKFRDETQRLRPRAFSIYDNSRKRGVLVPGQIGFDFSHDLLLVPEWAILFKSPHRTEYPIPDLEKIDTVVISWTCDLSFLLMVGLVNDICGMGNVKTVALIHQKLLGQERELCCYTREGPFWKGEDRARNMVRMSLNVYQIRHPGVKVPEVVSLRLSSCRLHKSQHGSKRFHAWAKHIKNGIAVRTHEAICPQGL